jgi:hypothetical protein
LTFVNILRDFVKRAKKERFTAAGFQIYLNNKGSLKDESKSPWVLDEPTGYFDYRALAFYADLVSRATGDDCPVRIRYRIDISRPQFDRGELRGKADLWVVSTSAFRAYPRLVADRARREGFAYWLYGQTSPVEASSRNVLAWVLEAYRGGAEGVVPWQTVDRRGEAMQKGDPLGLFIFAGDGRIHHSLRLKAYRRAQQDVEYLALARERLGLTAGQVRELVDRYVDLRGPAAPVLDPEGYRRLREAAAKLISNRR